MFNNHNVNANENLIINGDFEKGYGWEDWGGFSYISDPESVYSGKKAAVLKKGEGGAGSQIIKGILPGQTYTLSGCGKVDGINQESILGVEYFDNEGRKINGGRFIVNFSKITYMDKSITFSTIPGTSQLQVYVYVINLVDGGASYFDNIRLLLKESRQDSHINNGAFLPQDWFNTLQSPSDIKQYVSELKDKRIKYQFADIGLLNSDGSLEQKNYAGLANWIHYSKKTDPEQYIIIILSFNKRINYEKNGNIILNTQFGTDTFNNNIELLSNKLVNDGIDEGGIRYKVDGVHIDFESFLPDDKVLLNYLSYLRKHSLSNNHNFSVSAPVSYSTSKTWSNSYISDVAKIVDQINPMLYDLMGWRSPIDDQNSYQSICQQETKRFSDSIGDNGPNGERSQLLPLLPAYERRVVKSSLVIYHDPYVENMLSALNGLHEAIDNGANVHGAGIFWWESFIGHYPALYPSSYYYIDQDNWIKYWVKLS